MRCCTWRNERHRRARNNKAVSDQLSGFILRITEPIPKRSPERREGSHPLPFVGEGWDGGNSRDFAALSITREGPRPIFKLKADG